MFEFVQTLVPFAISALTIGLGFLLCDLFGVDVDITSWWVGLLSALSACVIAFVMGGRRDD